MSGLLWQLGLFVVAVVVAYAVYPVPGGGTLGGHAWRRWRERRPAWTMPPFVPDAPRCGYCPGWLGTLYRDGVPRLSCGRCGRDDPRGPMAYVDNGLAIPPLAPEHLDWPGKDNGAPPPAAIWYGDPKR